MGIEPDLAWGGGGELHRESRIMEKDIIKLGCGKSEKRRGVEKKKPATAAQRRTFSLWKEEEDRHLKGRVAEAGKREERTAGKEKRGAVNLLVSARDRAVSGETKRRGDRTEKVRGGSEKRRENSPGNERSSEERGGGLLEGKRPLKRG